MGETCILCQGTDGDKQLERDEVWSDALWRLTVARSAEVPGFAYLEPRRHIPSIAELEGEEARTFGTVLAEVTRVLREETGSERVYVYIFGDSVPHLHVHLAPHRSGDALNDQMIRGELQVEQMENGTERITSKDYPPLPESVQLEVQRRVRQRLAGSGR